MLSVRVECVLDGFVGVISICLCICVRMLVHLFYSVWKFSLTILARRK